MGVQLTDIIEPDAITFEDIFDKTIAIDAFNWIYQFLSIIRQPDGSPLQDFKGRTTSHLSGLFYRTKKLMESGIKPVYVFDGKPPEFKKVLEERRDVRAEAMKEWKKALEKKDYVAARKYAQRSVTINDEIIDSGKKLLDAMGIPVIQAPSEGEALCSLMCRNNDVWATATQDYDSLLFGCPRLIRNLSLTGKRKQKNAFITVNPEMFLLKKVISSLEITQDQLIITGILVGTDYNPKGVAGYGPKKALQLVKEKKTLDNVMKEIVWEFDISPEDIFNFFKNPENSEYKIEFSEINEEKVKDLLCAEHDFSEERIANALKMLKEKGRDQRSLSKWF